jgi:hypothetical protein
MAFADVMDGIKIFLMPVWEAIVLENEVQNTWIADERAWNKEKNV